MISSATAASLPVPDSAVRITYVLSRPELGGGNKVIFQHAELLLRNGDEVSVLADGPAPDWIDFRGKYFDYSTSSPKLPSQDLVIATFWTTLALTLKLDLGPAAHFCQGYEGSHEHYRDDWPQIEAAYGLSLPSFTVTPYLSDLLQQKFSTPSRVVPPPLDPLFRPRPRLRPKRRPWIALPGIYGARVKGLSTAIRAVEQLRQWGHACRVLRFSTLPLDEPERQRMNPDRYLVGVAPREIARALRGCDLLLMPSEAEEGFGLPLLEAMVSGVPAIASEIPSTVYMTDNVVSLVPVGDGMAMAVAARELLTDTALWRRSRRAGRRAARRFSPEAVAGALVDAVQWASQEPWVQEPNH